MRLLHPDMRPKPKPWDGRELLQDTRASVKMDGLRVTIWHRPDGTFQAIRRLPHVNFWPELRDHPSASWVREIPRGSVVDCEMHALGVPASSVVTLIKEKHRALRVTPFALPWWDHVDCRHDWAAHISAEHAAFALGSGMSLAINLGEVRRVTVAALTHHALLRDIEGVILKERPYSRWWKVKPQDTLDAVVLDARPGKGKHRGRWGSLEVALKCERTGEYHPVASIGKGADDEWRDLPLAQMLLRVVEVSHEGVQSNGRLRFSNFVRWREDKLESDCGLEQLQRVRRS